MAHTHDHPPRAGMSLGRAFSLGIALNVAFVVVEIAAGILAHSTALVADAVHNASDVLGLGLAWGAAVLARRTPSLRHTYGLRAGTVLAALANAVLLLLAIGGVSWEAVQRLAEPAPVAGRIVLLTAAVGVVVNGVSALFFVRDKAHDANVRAAFLHLAADAAVSLAVVVAGFGILRTGWNWLDPAASLLVSLLLLGNTWSLLRDALHLALAGVPEHIDIVEVERFLGGLAGVSEVHDLHVWPMGTTEIALTAHLIIPWDDEPPPFLATVPHELKRRFGIDHATVQLEPIEAGAQCLLAPRDVV